MTISHAIAMIMRTFRIDMEWHPYAISGIKATQSS
jgi:hypothetical protein